MHPKTAFAKSLRDELAVTYREAMKKSVWMMPLITLITVITVMPLMTLMFIDVTKERACSVSTGQRLRAHTVWRELGGPACSIAQQEVFIAE